MTRRVAVGRRTKAGMLGLVAVMGLVLGACSQSNTPDEYNTLTQQNFLETCTNYYFDNTDDTLSITDNTVSDKAVDPPTQSQCECQYAVYAGPNNDGQGAMPINSTVAKEAQWADYDGPNFTDLNAELKTDPQKAWDSVPQDIKDSVQACVSGTGSSTSTTTGGDSTTTTAPETTTTGA